VGSRWIFERQQGGKICYSVQFIVSHSHITITDEDWRPCYDIPVSWLSCHLGGQRPFFHCPQCGKRRAVLYSNGLNKFKCRECLNLGYKSQLENESYRSMGRSWKIEKRLGPWLGKPPGMHKTTYARLMRQHAYYDRKSLLAMAASLNIVIPGMLLVD